jgi:hypothetical protein
LNHAWTFGRGDITLSGVASLDEAQGRTFLIWRMLGFWAWRFLIPPLRDHPLVVQGKADTSNGSERISYT